jgi:hypothetical protein
MTNPKHQGASTKTQQPVGQYTNVSVVPIQGGSGRLTGGTATLSPIQMLSVGNFPASDRPEIGKYYNITGTHDGVLVEFPRWKCTHAGNTSDFAAN